MPLKKFKPKRHETKKFNLNQRESATKRGYDAKWYKYRKRFLKYNPNCYICGFKANVVDHIVAWKIDKDKWFWKEDNFMPCCARCHNTITGYFDQFKHPKWKEKQEWILKKRLENNITIKIKIVPIEK